VSAHALSLVQSLVDAVTVAVAAIEPQWQGNKVVLPYPVPEHNGEEDCCRGLVMGVLERVYLTDTFPIEATVQDPCRVALMAADVTISVLTCAPTGDRTGKVSFAKLTETAVRVWNQAQETWRATQCYMNAVSDEDPFFDWGFRGQTPRPQDEGCVGTDLALTFSIANRCGPCP
jgi:hypothetical protein